MSVVGGIRAAVVACALGAVAPAQATMCGTQDYPFPFTDVADVSDAFCKGIMQAFMLGVTRGSTPTTFSPNDNVLRLQMTTFLQRSFDQGQRRASKRAALQRWWTPQAGVLGTVPVSGIVRFCASDGEQVYAATETEVLKIDANTGRVAGTWTGLSAGRQPVVLDGRVFVNTRTSPGRIYVLDATAPPGPMTLVAEVANQPIGMAFDGARLWAAGPSGISIVDVRGSPPYPVAAVGGFGALVGVLYDGSNMWASDGTQNVVHRLDTDGAILQSVAVGGNPGAMLFDGSNLWVANALSNSVSVIVAATGVVAFTLEDVFEGGGEPTGIAFDGERILITGQTDRVVLYRAADASRIGTILTGAGSTPYAACSDGLRLWVSASGAMLRF